MSDTRHRFGRKPSVYWVYVYENADGTGGYNFETAKDFSDVAGICESFREEPVWRKCEVLGGDESGPSGDFDSFPGGWVR